MRPLLALLAIGMAVMAGCNPPSTTGSGNGNTAASSTGNTPGTPVLRSLKRGQWAQIR